MHTFKPFPVLPYIFLIPYILPYPFFLTYPYTFSPFTSFLPILTHPYTSYSLILIHSLTPFLVFLTALSFPHPHTLLVLPALPKYLIPFYSTLFSLMPFLILPPTSLNPYPNTLLILPHLSIYSPSSSTPSILHILPWSPSHPILLTPISTPIPIHSHTTSIHPFTFSLFSIPRTPLHYPY